MDLTPEWVDYSDEDSEDEERQEHHVESKPRTQESKPAPKQEVLAAVYKPSKEEVDHQLDRLDQLNERRVDQVWLLMESEDKAYLEEEMRYLKSKAKKGGNIVSVYPSRVAEGFDVLAYIQIAYDYIENGYDSSSRMKITVAERNFERRGGERNGDRNPVRDRRRQGEYKEKNTADKQGEKKKYVDKQTGKEPESKKKMEEKIMENNERRYTKEEAEKKGSMIGGFRNKPSKKEEEPEVIPEPPAAKKVAEEPKPKEEEKPAVVEVKEVKPKDPKKEKKDQPKKDAKPKAGVKTIKSQNRFEGIEDLD